MTSFIKVPFASSGDKTAVPDTDSGGSVNMTQGYGQAYSLDPATDPSAKRIERDKMNWLFNRITQAINEIQSGGVAPFITSADNGGSAFSYGKGVLVSLGGVVYQSLVASNTSTPPSANWAALPEKIQPLDATLTALAGLVGAANKLPYFNGTDTATLTDLTSVGRDIIGKTDIAAVLQYLGLDVALSNKQPLSDTLTKLATLGPQTDADQVLFFSGKNVPAVSALTLAGRQFISKESVPDMLQYLTLGDGTGRLLGVQAFGNSGTYTKSEGVTKIIVEAVGGGGASGNLSATASNNCGVSPAGSPGAYAKYYIDNNIPESVSLTVGSGGVGGAGPGGSGGDGGQTSFGTLLVCPGGKGSQQTQQIPPFSGGSATEASPPTGTGILFHSVSRSPSCAVLGLGAEQAVGLESTISTMLGVYGKGGVGKFNPANSPAANGNDGSQGYIIIWEYQ